MATRKAPQRKGKQPQKDKLTRIIHTEIGNDFPIYRSVGSSEIIYRDKAVQGIDTTFTTDSSGTVGAGATPANGVLTLGTSNFTTVWTGVDDLLQNVDMVIATEWFCKITPISNNPGVSYFWFDLDDITAASATRAHTKNAAMVSNSNTSATAGTCVLAVTPPKVYPYNAAFSPVQSPVPPTVYLKWFTASTLGSANSTAEFVVAPFVVVTAYGREV